jgi:hypothetical protein
MAKGSESKQEIFKQIFRDGYAVYICPACFAGKKVPFSGKRSFWLSCAKTYTANWPTIA